LKKMRKCLFLVLGAGVLLLSVGLIALAQAAVSADRGLVGSGYELSWWTVDGGGYTRLASSGGGYEMGGTAGQPDAGVLAGGGYSLGGGFWRGGATVGDTVRIYLPLVLRQAP
jgi:hypothetical protein